MWYIWLEAAQALQGRHFWCGACFDKKMCVCHQCNIILVITRVETRTTALNTVSSSAWLLGAWLQARLMAHITHTHAAHKSHALGAAPLATTRVLTARLRSCIAHSSSGNRHASSCTLRHSYHYDMHHRSDTITPRATCNTATTPATSLAHMH